jgi:hypothetical protein
MKIYPIVEAVDSRPWIIRSGPGAMDPEQRIMSVPLGTSGGDRHVRAHELAHVKITPKVQAHKQCKKFGVTNDALQCCEDLRVHSYLHRCGVPATGILSQPEADVLIAKHKDDLRSLATLLISSLFTADYPRLVATLEKVLVKDVHDNLLRNVRLINRRLHGGKKIYRTIGLRNCTIPAARLVDAIWPPEGDGHSISLPFKELQGRELRGRKGVKWGTIAIHHANTHVMRPVPRIALKKIFSDEGAVLSAPYRMPIDGRVFLRKKKAMGGTVLVDTSGSMHLSETDLQTILRAAPAATIAIYSGRAKTGTLTVVGDKGRLVNNEHLTRLRQEAGRGNVVDGPALEWLSQQPQPRIWVSDGIVTGTGDAVNLDLAADALRICRRAKIRRVEKADAATAFLRPRPRKI